MLNLFKRLISKWNEEIPEPSYGAETRWVDETLDESIPPEESEVEGFKRFMMLLTSRLGSETSTLISKRAIHDFESGKESAEGAFLNGTNLELDQKDHILSIYVDWKSYDEIEWQANRILRNLGIEDHWSWDPEVSGKSVPAGLFNLDDWLKQHGFCLLHINTYGDDANAFPIEIESTSEVISLAKRAGIVTYSSEGIRPIYGVD